MTLYGNSNHLSINDRNLLGIHNILYISISSLLFKYGRDCLSNGNDFVENGSCVEEESCNLDQNPAKDFRKYKHFWALCEDCCQLNYKKFLPERLSLCQYCGYHLKMDSLHRIELSIDSGTWDPMDMDESESMISIDAVEFDKPDVSPKMEALTEGIVRKVDLYISLMKSKYKPSEVKGKKDLDPSDPDPEKKEEEPYEHERPTNLDPDPSDPDPEKKEKEPYEHERPADLDPSDPDIPSDSDPNIPNTEEFQFDIDLDELGFHQDDLDFDLDEAHFDLYDLSLPDEPDFDTHAKALFEDLDELRFDPWREVDVFEKRELERWLDGMREKEFQEWLDEMREKEFQEWWLDEMSEKELKIWYKMEIRYKEKRDENGDNIIDNIIHRSTEKPILLQEKEYEKPSDLNLSDTDPTDQLLGRLLDLDPSDPDPEKKEEEPYEHERPANLDPSDPDPEKKEEEPYEHERPANLDPSDPDPEKLDELLLSQSDKLNSGESDFEEDESYKDKISSNQRKTGMAEAFQMGIGQLETTSVAIGVMDFEFIGGSMGSVVGERITRLIECAVDQSLPLIMVCASGGARMQEGSLSLMQMVKISSASYDHQSKKKLFYVSILTSPTTGGVTASFGMLGDVIFAEPEAYIAFAGKRVIEETLHVIVPEGAQETENLFEKGLFDSIVPRKILKGVLGELFEFHGFVSLNPIQAN